MGTPKMADGHRGIDPDTPLRLNMAVKIAFPAGGMTASGLRAESRRGRLTIETIANKQFVTLRAIELMRERCRDQPRVPGSGSSPKSEKRASSSAERHGSSETARTKNARAALEKTARELKGR
jgi:hypothetical protein